MIKELPKPKGSFQTGVKHLSFLDKSRIDPFQKAESKNREIPCLIWYPIDSAEGFKTRPFLSPDLLASIKEYKMYKPLSAKLCEIKTNSFEDAPISTRESKFPVVLFNFGFSSFMEQSYIQMENLASFGYIVVSIGHPFDGAVSYPDGRTVGIDLKAIEEMQKSQDKRAVKELRSIMKQLQSPLPAEEVERLSRKMFGAGAEMEKKIDLWVEDIRFIVDIVKKLDAGEIESVFKNKFLLDRGIGSYGHSYGGASSILAAAIDENISCAINQDGGMYGGFNQDYQFNKPTMYMESEETHGMSEYFYQQNNADTIMLHIKGAKHMDYSDFPVIHKPLIYCLLGIFGKINGERMVKLNSEYVLAFFNKYLKGIENPILEKSPYPEVVLKSRSL